MNLDTKTLTAKLQPFVDFLKRYATFVIFIGMLFAAIFLVFRINQFSDAKPDQDVVTEKLQNVQRPRLDADALEKIQQLESQHIEVQSLFDQARNNPFSE